MNRRPTSKWSLVALSKKGVRTEVFLLAKWNKSEHRFVHVMRVSKRRLLSIFVAILLGAGVYFVRPKVGIHPENQRPGKFPEQLVFVRSIDDVVSGGVMFTPTKESSKPLAVIWVHGWGANFYSPSYVGIGRALAERGFTTISVNTRMHDIGNVEKYTPLGKRVRGGGYWGVTSEDSRDIAAWIGFADHVGYSRVILVGHSAGWASVGRYQADSGDQRVAGLAFASPAVGDSEEANDAQLLTEAKKLVRDGAGEALLSLPHRAFPSFISAATHLDIVTTPREYKDFFGIHTPNPAVMRVNCPILAFFGSRADVGGERELNLLKSSVQHLSRSPRIDTTMIVNGNHEYVGEEEQVAQKIVQWAESESLVH
jgi:pimeloyl-ACP methyl ester carboxylesterase